MRKFKVGDQVLSKIRCITVMPLTQVGIIESVELISSYAKNDPNKIIVRFPMLTARFKPSELKLYKPIKIKKAKPFNTTLKIDEDRGKILI